MNNEVLWVDELPPTNIGLSTDVNCTKSESYNNYCNMTDGVGNWVPEIVKLSPIDPNHIISEICSHHYHMRKEIAFMEKEQHNHQNSTHSRNKYHGNNIVDNKYNISTNCDDV